MLDALRSTWMGQLVVLAAAAYVVRWFRELRAQATRQKRAARRRADPDTPRAIIVGGGFSGLAVAKRLNEEGIPYVLLEKQSELGGTWYANQYPGAACVSPKPEYPRAKKCRAEAHLVALQLTTHRTSPPRCTASAST